MIRFCLLLGSLFLTGCVSGVWTGANLVYDRHSIYKKASDYELKLKIHHDLYYKDTTFRTPCSVIDVAVFNGDILIAGHVCQAALRDKIDQRINALGNFRHYFNQIAISNAPSNEVEDAWITAQIRSNMLADSSINLKQFKVVTVDKIVYLMGDVLVDQAKKVILIARRTKGVTRVVTLFNYYQLTRATPSF